MRCYKRYRRLHGTAARPMLMCSLLSTGKYFLYLSTRGVSRGPLRGSSSRSRRTSLSSAQHHPALSCSVAVRCPRCVRGCGFIITATILSGTFSSRKHPVHQSIAALCTVYTVPCRLAGAFCHRYTSAASTHYSSRSSGRCFVSRRIVTGIIRYCAVVRGVGHIVIASRQESSTWRYSRVERTTHNSINHRDRARSRDENPIFSHIARAQQRCRFFSGGSVLTVTLPKVGV